MKVLVPVIRMNLGNTFSTGAKGQVCSCYNLRWLTTAIYYQPAQRVSSDFFNTVSSLHGVAWCLFELSQLDTEDILSGRCIWGHSIYLEDKWCFLKLSAAAGSKC